MDRVIFPCFIKHLDTVDRCVQVCFADVRELGTTWPSRSPLWITMVLCANYPQPLQVVVIQHGGVVASALECLLEYVQLLVEFGQLLTFATDLAHGMQHGGVVAPTE